MENEKTIYCSWNLIKDLKERELSKKYGKFYTISVTNKNKQELMIFLKKNSSSYEVTVYKERNGKYYIPDEAYNIVKRYTDTDMDKTFFFERFDEACYFIDCVAYYKTHIFVDYCGNIFKTSKRF